MTTLRRRVLLTLAVLIAAAAVLVPLLAPGIVERRMNGVLAAPLPAPSAHARELHARLRIADLHADTLLWKRDLLERGTRGQVDVPRLAEGNVALQAFTVVTKSPKHLNYERNDDTTDDLTLLSIVQLRPPRAWTSLLARALDAADRLHRAAGASQGRLTVVHTAGELRAFLSRREKEPGIVAGLLGLEGSHAIEGNLDNVDVLYRAGYRMAAPTHFFDTDLAGSAHGIAKGGLTAKGRDWVRRMESHRMLVDVAHASPTAFADVVGMASRPVVVSHTGVKATCDRTRNLSDDQLRAVAATGGVVGIGYWDEAVCGTDPAAIARAIRHATSVIGADHVALGSDFDGAVTTPFDAAGLVHLTDALLAQGMSDDDVKQVMGENTLRLMLATLPE
jgi:membrane dipeptidase